MMLRLKNLIFSKGSIWLLPALVIVLGSLLTPQPAHASVSLTGGDGFVPIIYQTKVFNVFHHAVPTGNPASPKYDINCVDTITLAICSGYPRFFSSTVGSSGSPSIGTPGTADILTGNMPHTAIEGSRLFYTADRAGDNGIGCFDLDTATNCGYFALGSLTYTGGFDPPHFEGLERIDNKLFAIGDDLNMYCLDITDPLSPVACTSQPYALNTGISAQLPASAWGRASQQVIDGKVYFLVNYKNNGPSANARISCFDPALNDRCLGWTSLEVLPGSFAVSYSLTLFEFPSTSGQSSAICTAQLNADPVQCWNLLTQLPVSAPTGLFASLPVSEPVTAAEELRIANKSYFALFSVPLFQSATANQGLAVCYDFTTQARCSGFGSAGVKLWDGADGGLAVNGGNTRDYGYAANGRCMFGLGDAGILWSFDRDTGAVPSGTLSCTFPDATPILPNTGIGLANRKSGLVPGILSLGALALLAIGWSRKSDGAR